MEKKVFLFISFLILLSCNNLDENSYSLFDEGEIVLKERDSGIPLILSQKKRTRSLNSSALSFRDHLGFSYKVDNLPIGSSENMGFRVIDIDRLENDKVASITNIRLGTGNASSFAYSSFDRYSVTSKVDEKIETGFTLKLGLFSIGNTKKMQEIFTSSSTSEKTAVFGELSVDIKDSKYTLQTSTNIINKIKFDYLDEIFVDELYNTHPSELFKNYGGFVLKDFITGGRATALYVGRHLSEDSTEIKERNMRTDINASYEFSYKEKEDGKFTGNLGIGSENYSGSETSHKIDMLQTSIKTLGGSLGTTSFTIPKSITDMNIDLSGWLNSLNDKSTHSIINISDKGLVPLTAFFQEKNFQDQFNRYYTNGVINIERLNEPYVCIADVVIGQNHNLMPFLVTRFGEHICFPVQSTLASGVFDAINSLKSRYAELFGTKIVYKQTTSFDEVIVVGYTYFLPPRCFNLEQTKKFIDKKTNTIYILDGEQALSIHNDYILDTYGIRKYVDKLPLKEMTRDQLLKYTIIAM